MFSKDQYINDRYQLIKLLGKGGFSVVWLAEDTFTDTRIAIKIFAPDKGLDKNGLAQFQKEYKRTRGLKHPHLLVPEHFDIIKDTNSPFLVMPFCPNGSLSDLIAGDTPGGEGLIAKILSHIGNALTELHAKKMIHQDIKPDNILVDHKNNFQLTDFGISRQMRSTLNKATANQSYMTVAYAPPERYSANPINTPASDVFSLGVMIYELCTHSMPWDGNGGMVLNSGAAIPNLPESYSNRLNAIIKSCMAKEPEARPAAVQLQQAGDAFLNDGAWPEFSPGQPKTDPRPSPASGRRTQKMDHVDAPAQGATMKDENIGFSSAGTEKQQPQGPAQKKGRSKKWIGWTAAAIVILGLMGGGIYYTGLSSPYEMKITEADAHFNAGEYEQAKEDYLMAVTMDGDPAYPSNQIVLVNEQIYQMHIDSADALFADANYERAINSYTNALKFKTDDSYALTRLDDSNNARFEQQGDVHFANGQYEEAIADYRRALEFTPGDSYPQQRISESQSAINRQQSQARQRRLAQLYQDYKQRGDSHYNAGEYESAIADYNTALEYKPGDSYANSQISKSEKMLPFSYVNNFSYEGDKFTNYRDDDKIWINEGGYLKGFSYNDSYSFNKNSKFERLKDAKSFEVSVRVRHIRGGDGYSFGLLFAGDGSDPSNRFGISGSGKSHSIGFYDSSYDKSWQTTWVSMDAGNRSGYWNTLRLVYNGYQFVYYVNGTEVHRRQAELFGDYYGMYFSGNMEEAWFDDFTIKATF